MGCAYCGEQDEGRLILSSRVVNGRVEQKWICFNCIWRDEFVHEDGRILPEELHERTDTRTESIRAIYHLSLQE